MDINNYLTGNPQITFFKSVYRRHTPFLKFTDEINIGEQVLNKNNPISKITHKLMNGKFDLISDIFLKHKLKLNNTDTIYANIGNNLIDNITLKVGSTDLYHTTGFIMEMISELENPFIPSMYKNHICPPYLTGKNGSLTVNTGNNYNISCFAGGVSGSTTTTYTHTETFFTRPNFDFCKSYDKSFPLCALIHSDVNFLVEYNPSNVSGSFANASLSRAIVIEGISLGNEEKRRVISNTTEYMYFDIKPQTNNTFKVLTPIRTIYIVNKPFSGDPSTSNSSASLSKSTPTLMNKSDFNNFSLKSDVFIYKTTNANNNIDILTKYNVHKYYGDNSFGGRELIDLSETITSDTGFLGSIAIISAGLENSDHPNGHFSAGSTVTITVGGLVKQIYTENINFYSIISGHLGKLYE